MKEQIKLLMEETGCEANEADLALTLCENDIERAVKTIGILLKYIIAFKVKLHFKESNLFALVHLVVNAKTSEILRFSCVVSYNPQIYETSIGTDWFTFEKTVYSFRLDKGTVTDYTQGVSPKLQEFFTAKLKETPVIGIDEVKGMLAEFFAPQAISVEITSEELNLAQFKKLPDYNFEDDVYVFEGSQDKLISLTSEILQDPQGKPAARLAEGDVVLALITDERDIAHYLSHLVGSRRDGKIIAFPAKVKKVTLAEPEIIVELFYTSSILGKAKTAVSDKIKVIESKKQQSWWEKIVPWW